MKKCIKCNEIKALDNYYKAKGMADGYRNNCKVCMQVDQVARNRTKTGVLRVIYNNQTQSSKDRNHAFQDYSKQELTDWALAQPLFHELYDKWVLSDYNWMQSVSLDRDDDSKPYTLDSLVITTWEKNRAKYYADRKAGRHSGNGMTKNKTVEQFTLDEKYIATFHSIQEASRQTKVNYKTISNACNGRTKNPKIGYKWQFAKEG